MRFVALAELFPSESGGCGSGARVAWWRAGESFEGASGCGGGELASVSATARRREWVAFWVSLIEL